MGLITDSFISKTRVATKEEAEKLNFTYLTFPDGMMYEGPEYEGKPIPVKKIKSDEEDEGEEG